MLKLLEWCSEMTNGMCLCLGATPLGGSTTTATAPIAHHTSYLGGSMPKIEVTSGGHSLLSVRSGGDGMI